MRESTGATTLCEWIGCTAVATVQLWNAATRETQDWCGPHASVLGGSPAGARGEGENSHGQYVGTDWRQALSRNVTVSLEFAEHDLGRCEDCGDALVLVGEALAECRRLLALPAPTTDATLLDMLDARGVTSIYFADGSQFNPGSMSIRAALATLRTAFADLATSTPGAPTP